MQHGFDAAGGEGVADLARQARHRNHPVGGVGDDPQAGLAEFAGQVPGEIGAGQIQQRRGLLQLFRFHLRQYEVTQARGIAAGRHHVGKPGLAGGAGGMLSYRKQW